MFLPAVGWFLAWATNYCFKLSGNANRTFPIAVGGESGFFDSLRRVHTQ
jgi:hypothetical protein